LTLAAPALPLPAKPSIVELPLGSALVRIYNPSSGLWDSPRFFGPIDEARFDHHPRPKAVHATRSVWYASTSLRGAVAEAFGKIGLIDRFAGLRIVKAQCVGTLPLLDLIGVAVKKVKLTQEIATTTDYALCQSYGAAFYDEYTNTQGIRWRGREIGSINVVLNDRANMASLSPTLDEDITHLDIWSRIARAARECGLEIV